jgi:hypothetical protein
MEINGKQTQGEMDEENNYSISLNNVSTYGDK